MAYGRKSLFKFDAGHGKVILHSSPLINRDILIKIKSIVDSRMIAQGRMVEAFEKQLSHYLGGNATICVGSGTAALVLSLKSLNVGIGDQVVLPTLVCRNVLEAISGNGSTPVLCDVGDNWVATYDTIRSCVTRKTKAIIVPHLYGIKADIKNIKKIGVPIIEDCAQAFGRTEKKEIIGTEGDLATFSFHATKCLTTGEGGAVMIPARNRHLIRRLFQLRDGGNGFSRMIFSPMSDISAGIGIAQLKKYGFFLEKRFDIARKYDRIFTNKDSVQMLNTKEYSSIYFRYVVKTRKAFSTYVRKFLDEGIIIRRGTDLPLHRLTGRHRKDFQNAEFLYEHTVSLPIYPALTKKEILHICQAAERIFY